MNDWNTNAEHSRSMCGWVTEKYCRSQNKGECECECSICQTNNAGYGHEQYEPFGYWSARKAYIECSDEDRAAAFLETMLNNVSLTAPDLDDVEMTSRQAHQPDINRGLVSARLVMLATIALVLVILLFVGI